MKLEKILNDARLKGTRRKATLLIQREMKKQRPVVIVCGIILFICMFCGIYCWAIGTQVLDVLDTYESTSDSVPFENMIVRWVHNVVEWNVGGLPAWAAWLIAAYIPTVVISSIGVLLGEAVVSFWAAKTCKIWRTKDLTECCGKAYEMLSQSSFYDPVKFGGIINAIFCAIMVIMVFAYTIMEEQNSVWDFVYLAFGGVIACFVVWVALWLVSGLPCIILDWKCLFAGTSEREKFREFWMEIDPVEKARLKAPAKAAKERRKQEEAIHQSLLSMPLDTPSNTSSNISSSSSIDHDALDAVQDAMNDLYGPGWGSDI